MKLSFKDGYVKAYMGKTDSEEEMLFILGGIIEADFNKMDLEFSEGHPMSDLIDIEMFEEMFQVAGEKTSENKYYFWR